MRADRPSGAAHGPSVKLKNNGEVYLLVHTKRGPRARQITQQGWEWVRAKYPSQAYPDREEIPLTYSDYKELGERGDIYVGTAKPRKWRATTAERPVSVASTVNASVRPVAPIFHPSPIAVAPIASSKCKYCNSGIPTAAQFCPRCGTDLYAANRPSVFTQYAPTSPSPSTATYAEPLIARPVTVPAPVAIATVVPAMPVAAITTPRSALQSSAVGWVALLISLALVAWTAWK